MYKSIYNPIITIRAAFNFVLKGVMIWKAERDCWAAAAEQLNSYLENYIQVDEIEEGVFPLSRVYIFPSVKFYTYNFTRNEYMSE